MKYKVLYLLTVCCFSALLSNAQWSLTGNSGTSPGTNFLGTTDGQRLVLKTNNTEQATLTTSGNFGLGTNSPRYKIDLAGIGADSQEDMIALGVYNGPSIGSSTQLGGGIIWQANYTGYTKRSAGILHTAESNGFQSGLAFFTNGNVDETTDFLERMRINKDGNVGIGTATPGEKLDINGNIKFSGALMPNNTAGSAGQVLTSAGSGSAPTWTTPSGSGWSLTGNSGTDSATNFIGTTDDKRFSIRTNDLERIAISKTGRVSFITPLNTNVDDTIFSINGGTTYAGTHINLFEQSSSGSWAFKAWAGSPILSFNSNSMLLWSGSGIDVDFSHSGQVIANSLSAQRLRGSAWFHTAISVDAPSIEYKPHGANYVSPGGAAHKFTVYSPLTDSTVNIATFDNGDSSLVTISKDGKVLIGTTNLSQAGSNILAVNGGAIFTKATVKLNTNWPDFVFEEKYGLLPIAQLEEYIKVNKHLPNVPAASQVTKDGIDLGGNQALLLQKIEELTLYIIEQNKKIELLEKDMIKIKKDQPGINN